VTGAQRLTELGVFLPVGNGGWITSTTSPQLPATYEYNRDVTLLAEDLGFDFALSMAKWRGYGGPSQHWDVTLESLSTTAALAEATSRIGVWATLHTMVFHPAVVAKMAAVIDAVSGGRFGINLVAGSNPYDQGQFGLWKDLDHEERYELAEEWITVARRLWTEPRVDFAGKHFTLEDCVSNPKPKQVPPIICAAGSDTGFRFTVTHCNGNLLAGSDDPAHIARARRAKQIAAELGRPEFKTYGLFTLVPGDTDEEAQARVEHYNSGVDLVALEQQAFEYSNDTRAAGQNTAAKSFIQLHADALAVSKSALVGSPETIARRLATSVREGQLDGICVIVPDFIDDLRILGEEIAPRLAKYGVHTAAGELAAL
jgi:pyrimidine oxygenase